MDKKKEDIEGKLDQIIRILSLQVGADKSITERAWLLKLVGLDNRTISEVLNTNQATIRTLLSRAKKELK